MILLIGVNGRMKPVVIIIVKINQLIIVTFGDVHILRNLVVVILNNSLLVQKNPNKIVILVMEWGTFVFTMILINSVENIQSYRAVLNFQIYQHYVLLLALINLKIKFVNQKHVQIF